MNPEHSTGEFEVIITRVQFLKHTLERELSNYEKDQNLFDYNSRLYREIIKQLNIYIGDLRSGREVNNEDIESTSQMVQIFIDDLKRKKLLASPTQSEKIN